MVENNETALLVPAHNPQAIAEAIGRLLSDQQLATRLAENAGALVSSRFSPETYARSLAEIYREVISKRKVRKV
jgi:glycosyltransferase involved in cell wall biosynthesis